MTRFFQFVKAKNAQKALWNAGFIPPSGMSAVLVAPAGRKKAHKNGPFPVLDSAERQFERENSIFGGARKLVAQCLPVGANKGSAFAKSADLHLVRTRHVSSCG
jgi:hypothetical protein